MKTSKKAFTTIKLLIHMTTIAILVSIPFVIWGTFWIGIGLTVCKGNYWVQEDKILKAIQVDNPEIIKIIAHERNIYHKSITIAEDKENNRYTFYVDTDVLQNVSVSKEK